MAYKGRGKVVMPDIIVIRHGGKYIPDTSGGAGGASPATLLEGDFQSCITADNTSNLLKIVKF